MERRRWKLLTALAAASLGLLVSAGVSATEAAPAAPAAGTPGAPGTTAEASAWNRLKQLEGEWQGATESGVPIVLRYHVGSGGTLLTETQAPGTDDEMVSVYSINGSALVMTHYCPMGPHGNQPHFRLDAAKATADSLDFSFTGGDNLDPAKDTHVHGGRFVFLPDGRLERDWTIYSHGKAAGNQRFLLKRKS